MRWRDYLGFGPPITLNLGKVARDAAGAAPPMFELRSSREPFTNYVTGQGTDRDPLSAEVPRWTFDPLRKEYIDNLYRMEGLARRIVELPPEYATQAGAESWVVRDRSPDAAPLEDVAIELELHQRIYEADVAARKYGDAAIFMCVEESGVFDEDQQMLPLDLDRVTGVRDLVVVEAHEMRIVEVQRELGAVDGPTIGEPILWDISINRPHIFLSLRVHASRLVMFHGAHVGYSPTTNTAKGWGHDSVLEGACRSFMGVNQARRARSRVADRVMTWFAKTKFPKSGATLKDKAQEILTALQNRWALLRTMTSLGVGLLDEGEDIQQLNAPISGIGELTKSAAEDICFTTGLPMGLLIGDIGGWSKGEGWEAAWRVKVASYQKNRYLGPLTRIYTVLFAARGAIPQFSIVFAPLESMGPMETTEERLKRYQSYRILVDIFGANIARIIWRSVVKDGDHRDLQPARIEEEPDWSTWQPPGSKVPAAVTAEAAPGSALAELAAKVYGEEGPTSPRRAGSPVDDASDFSDSALLAFSLSDDDVQAWRAIRDAAAAIVPLEGHGTGDPLIEDAHLTVLYFGAVKRSAKADAIRDLIAALASATAPEPEPIGVRVFPAKADGRCPIVIEMKPKGLSGLYRKALTALVTYVSATQFPKYRPHVTLGYARPTDEERALLEALEVPAFHPLPELTLTWQGSPALYLPLE